MADEVSLPISYLFTGLVILQIPFHHGTYHPPPRHRNSLHFSGQYHILGVPSLDTTKSLALKSLDFSSYRVRILALLATQGEFHRQTLC